MDMRINKDAPARDEGKTKGEVPKWHLELVKLRDEGCSFPELTKRFPGKTADSLRGVYHRTLRRLKGYAGQRPVNKKDLHSASGRLW